MIVWDGLDAAIVGVGQRCGMQPAYVYSYEKMAQIMMERDGITHEDACEYIDYNIVGAYVGEGTPITLYNKEEE